MKKIAYILLSSAFAFVLFSRCVGFSYIGLDDAAYTFRNPFVAGGLSVPNVVEAFVNLRHGGIWMPVTYISYMCDASFCRLTGFPLIGEMHFVNLLLHVANLLLLWNLIRQLFGSAALDGTDENQQHATNSQLSTLIAALAAMIWAIHPLRAEPVAWIAARKELLWTLFTLVGLIFWIRGDGERGTGNGELQTLNSQLSTIICCALACLSKPTAMCFPFLLLLVTWSLRKEDQRIAHPQLSRRNSQLSTRNSTRSTRSTRLNYQLVPLFLLAAATAAIAAYSQTHVAGQDAVALYAAPISHRLVNALSAIGYYLRATFWPFGLHVDCRSVPGLWPLDAGWNFVALGVAVLAVGSTRSTRLIIFSVLWFLISLSPTLGLFGSFGMEAHADRFAYLPSMAISFLIAGFAFVRSTGRDGDGFDNRVERPERVDCGMNSTRSTCSTRLNSKLLTLIVIVLLSFVTFQQLSHWRDDCVAHQRILDCDPGHPRAMVHVADARCSRQRDFDGGIRLYRKALSLAGTVPKGGFNMADTKARLAYALASRGGYEDFREVKSLGADVLQDFRRDRRGMMLDALGTAFMSEGDYNRAAILFKASIEAPDRFWPKASTRRKLESCK